MNDKAVGHAFAIIPVILWGACASIIITLYDYFTATDVVFMEFFLGYLVFCLVQRKPLKVKSWKHEGMLFAMGALGITATCGLQNMAYHFATSGTVNVLYSTSPIFVAIIYMIIKRKALVGVRFWIGGLVALIGCCMVAMNGFEFGQSSPLGIILGFGCAITWAAYMVVYDYLDQAAGGEYEINGIMRRMFFYGFLTTLLLFPFVGTNIRISSLIIPKNIALILFLGIMVGAVSYLLWNISCVKIGGAKANIYMYGLPFVTFVVSGIVLGETVNVIKIAGCTLSVIGVVLSQSDQKMEQRTEPSAGEITPEAS